MDSKKTYKQKLGEALVKAGQAVLWVGLGVVLFATSWISWAGKKGFEYLEKKTEEGYKASAAYAAQDFVQAGSDIKEAYQLRSEAQATEATAQDINLPAVTV